VKDTLRNVEAQGEFVVNLATYELREAVNASAAPLPRGADEFRHAGLTPRPSRLVRPPAVQESPVQLECRLHQVIRLPGEVDGVANHMVLGAVLGVAIGDELIEDGRVRIDRLRPISRLGYMDYAVTDAVFTMERPTLAPRARPEAVAQD
jgi:flavin reductase (DIM6/NTAB) family NADH-FMN oxidoreductase RutF